MSTLFKNPRMKLATAMTSAALIGAGGAAAVYAAFGDGGNAAGADQRRARRRRRELRPGILEERGHGFPFREEGSTAPARGKAGRGSRGR